MQQLHKFLANVFLRRSLVVNIVASVAFTNLNEDLDPFVWIFTKMALP